MNSAIIPTVIFWGGSICVAAGCVAYKYFSSTPSTTRDTSTFQASAEAPAEAPAEATVGSPAIAISTEKVFLSDPIPSLPSYIEIVKEDDIRDN